MEVLSSKRLRRNSKFRQKLKVKNNIFDVVDKINKNQSLIISNLILKILRINKINKILFLGFSFKENTDDYRNSPTLEIVKELKEINYQFICMILL